MSENAEAEHPAIKALDYALHYAHDHTEHDEKCETLWWQAQHEVRVLIAERDALPPDVRAALRTVCDAYAYAYCTPDADRAVALVRRLFGLTVERTEPT